MKPTIGAAFTSLEFLNDKKIGTTKKEFTKLEQELPCRKCIVLAACKNKVNIKCGIVQKYIQISLGFGVNTLWIYKELACVFPKCLSLNGTVII